MNKETTGKTKKISLFHKGTLQHRIFMITLSGILLVCLIVAAISFYIFRNYLKDAMISTTRTSLSNLSTTIDNHTDNVLRLARYCQGSSDIATYIEASPEPGSVLSVATYDRLNEEYLNNESNSYIPRCVVIAGSHFLQSCTTTYSTVTDLADAVPKLSFFDQLLNAKGYDFSTGIIADPFLKGKSRYVIPIVRPITYKFNSTQIGYLYMEVSADLFTDQMSHYYMDEGSSLYLAMPEHIYRYENGSLTELDPGFFSLDEIVGDSTGEVISTQVRIDGDFETVVASPLNFTGCYLIQSVSPASLRSERRSFILMFAAILASIIAIGVLLMLSFDHYIQKPLDNILKKIGLTAAGDFSRDPSIEYEHELGDVGRGINDLSESVNSLMETKLLDEKQKRDLEYQMLQSQINPHFIYNALNSIKMMAAIQGATGISEMTTALASLLRSISKGTSLLVPIEEELSLVKDYFTIQNYRYGGMITFRVDLKDPEIIKSRILKFTLQPLVENAIFHGLEPKGGTGAIDLTLSFVPSVIRPGKRDILIEVKDDGVGIAPDKIQKILEGTSAGKADFFKEIGIHNVDTRLQYEFGADYGISIESEEGSYTVMKVLIPESEEEEHV